MKDIENLLDIMAALRDPASGCPWDLEQDFGTIAPYTIEEAYEVADAIERGAWAELEGELGDLLLQVVFHAQLAREQGLFTFDDVTRAITDKLVRRHPHVFGDTRVGDADAQRSAWEAHKRREREDRAGSAAGTLDGVARALPALLRAAKLGRRAAAVGFDWPDAEGPRRKIDEELGELDHAIRSGATAEAREELGDVLFAVVNLARHHGIDPEAALREANAKFETRFRRVESELRAAGAHWQDETPESLDARWRRAKRRDGEPPGGD